LEIKSSVSFGAFKSGTEESWLSTNDKEVIEGKV